MHRRIIYGDCMIKALYLVIIFLICCIVAISSCAKVQEDSDFVETNSPVQKSVDKQKDVLIFIGSTSWIDKELAAVEARTTKNLLEAKGIRAGITESVDSVADWMLQTNANGAVNVCILYGVIPATIYAAENTQPEGSIAENWIESTDGDTILNHADYLGYYSSDETPNYKAPLQNLMDLPNIDINVEQFEELQMHITESGKTITPSLVSFQSDRPFPLEQLDSDWYAEMIFASDTGDDEALGADPIILRDGDRGRIAMVHQTHHGNESKGEVAAQIIINYLLDE